jgi:hypothetical protein
MTITINLNDTHREIIATSRLVDGAATDADSTPTVTVYEQGTAMAYAPAVTNKATGEYEAAIVCSAANGFEAGKEYSASVTAVVDGVTGKAPLCAFRVVTGASDAPTVEEIVAAIVAHSHDTGVTVEGLLIRLEAFLSGLATGMNGPLGKWYKRGGLGAGVAFEGAVDPTAGTRAESDVSGSEPP